MRLKKLAVLGLAGLVLAGAAVVVRAADDEAIGKIMKKNFKGDNSIAKKIAQNKASDDEKKQFFEAVQELAKLTPPRGAGDSWKEKTDKLVKAAESATKGEAGSPKKVEDSANCKKCHTAHKEN